MLDPTNLLAFVIAILSTSALLNSTALAQKKDVPPPRSSLCTQGYAVDTIQQTAVSTRTFDNAVQRITVLLRTADLLWPYRQAKALAEFMEAFDLAVKNFKASGEELRPVSKSQFAAVIRMSDQRYEVISALAKRDPAAARKLSDQMLQDEAREAAEKPAADAKANERTAEELLMLAHGLVATDTATAVSFARSSFRYPATFYLPMFLYDLSKANKLAADRLYEDALLAYGSAPMDQFLYLSAYPFGNTRDAGEMPSYMSYGIPEGFTPNPRLQRLFTQRLLARVQVALETPIEASETTRYSDPAQMWLALSRLESQIQTNLPDLSDATTQLKDKLFALLNPASQRRVDEVLGDDNQPKKSFDEQVEAAEKLSDVGQRDQGLTSAVTQSSTDEP